MAPRGGKNPRRGKMTFELVSEPAPKYTQRTLTSTQGMSTQGLSTSRPDTSSTPCRDTSATRTPTFVPRDEVEDEQDDDASRAGCSVRGEDMPYEIPGPGDKKPVVEIFGGKLVGDKYPRFFLNTIQRSNCAFWPSYSDIDPDVRDSLWTTFLSSFTLKGDPVYARTLFEAENAKKWRDFLTKQKAKALKKVENRDPTGLNGSAPPKFARAAGLWDRYILHWCSEEQRAKAATNKANRMSAAGRADGKPSTHGMGSKSLHARMFEEWKVTGVMPSALRIIININKVKDPVTGLETGVFRDPKLQAAYEEYKVLFAAKYGDEKDPLESLWDKDLWCSTEPVRAGLAKGRMLGAGTSGPAQLLMETNRPDVATAQIEALTQENESLKAKVDEVQSDMETVKGNLETMQGNFAKLERMMDVFMSGGSSANSSVSSSQPTNLSAYFSQPTNATATELLAQQMWMRPPE